jgi:hypothetical protein
VKIRRKPSEWLALMPNAREGYLRWEKAETLHATVLPAIRTMAIRPVA